MSETADFSRQQVDSNKLLAILRESFGEDDLRDLCFELQIEYEDLPADGKSNKARELVLRCERERRLPELAEAVLSARYHIPRHSLIRDTRMNESPFKGLLAYEEADEAIFYGREALTTDLLTRFIPPTTNNQQPTTFLALIGASGSGKSSVVRAGLLPALRRQTNWPIHLMTPTTHPLETLAVSLTRESESVTAVTTLIDDLRRDPRSLHLYIRRLSTPHLLLVIDQFEELFTLCRDEAEKQAFVENLVYAAQPETAGPTIAILTLRADFYSHCLQFESLHRLLEQQQKIVPAMNTAELREAIERPAARAGLVFEEGLVELLLRDIGATGSQSPEPGALPLLSHVLLETWGRREGDRLTLAGYSDAGGVHGAIAKTAESTYQHLTPAQQAIARNIFLRLTELGEGTQDTRRRADLDELLPRTAQAAEVETVLKLLADARLVTTHEDAAEVAHEALIREWPTLRRWLDEDREGLRIHRQLTEDAMAWEKMTRDVNYLYRGGRLAQAREWASRPDAALNELEQAFLDAGLAQQQDELAEAQARAEREAAAARREAEAARKLRQRAVFLRGALVIAGALAIVSYLLYVQSSRNLAIALYNEQLASIREAEANSQRQKALVQSLGVLSAVIYERDQNPELAILLGIEAARLNESNELGVNSLIDNSLRSILQKYAYYQDTLTGHKDGVSSVAFNPDGQTLASGSFDGTIRLWDMSQPTAEPLVLTGNEDGVYSVAFSPDGQTLASGGFDGTIRLWDMNQPTAEPLALPGYQDVVLSVAFSPDGQTLANGSTDGTIRLWDMSQPAAGPVMLTGHEGPVNTVAFSLDGQTLASGSNDGTIRLWDMSQPTAEPLVLIGHEDGVLSVAFSPDGQTLASGSGNGTIRLWDMTQPTAEPLVLPGYQDRILSVAFSPDGQTLASGSTDRTIRLWDMTQPTTEPLLLTGHEDWVNSVAFSPDGQTLASGSDDGFIHLWDMNQPAAEPLVLTGHEDWFGSVAFSPDGQILASGSDNGTIHLWDMNQPTAEPLVLTGHENEVSAVAFSPDGQTLASGSLDTTIRLWDMNQPTAEPVVLTGHEGWVRSVAFSPDGQTLASGSDDRTIWLWSALEELVEFGCQQVGRNLNWAEWQRYLPGEPYRQTCPNLPRHSSVPPDG
jgi:WD40 repeat protein